MRIYVLSIDERSEVRLLVEVQVVCDFPVSGSCFECFGIVVSGHNSLVRDSMPFLGQKFFGSSTF